MANDAFSAARWDHWLLLISFISFAIYGLWLSAQWKRPYRRRHQRVKRVKRVNRERIYQPTQLSKIKLTKKRQVVLRSLGIRK